LLHLCVSRWELCAICMAQRANRGLINLGRRRECPGSGPSPATSRLVEPASTSRPHARPFLSPRDTSTPRSAPSSPPLGHSGDLKSPQKPGKPRLSGWMLQIVFADCVADWRSVGLDEPKPRSASGRHRVCLRTSSGGHPGRPLRHLEGRAPRVRGNVHDHHTRIPSLGYAPIIRGPHLAGPEYAHRVPAATPSPLGSSPNAGTRPARRSP